MLVRQLQQDKSLVTSAPPFFLTQSCSWGVFVLLPGAEDRSELTSAVVIHVPLGKLVPCPLIEQLTPVTPLTLQSINCLVL